MNRLEMINDLMEQGYTEEHAEIATSEWFDEPECCAIDCDQCNDTTCDHYCKYYNY